jgi:alkylation response protein AidB-like acyl-CoA dehydrogenase
VRAFLAEERAADHWRPRADVWLSGWDERFSRELGRRGWLGMTIPAEYGGAGASPLDRYVVTEELLAAGAPVAAHWVADRQIGPSLLRFGTEAQRRRFLPGIVAGEVYFGIGMSEPDAGSDLAAVRTKAEKVDGGWALTGTKVWTSGAHHAHAFFALARSSPRDESNRHAGLSQFLVELDSPGVRIRPIPLLTGAHHFNEVVFDRVFVPDDMVFGEIGAGSRSPASWPSNAAAPSGSCRPTRCWPRWSGSWPGPPATSGRSAAWSRGCGRCAGCRWRWPGRWPPGRPRSWPRRW